MRRSLRSATSGRTRPAYADASFWRRRHRTRLSANRNNNSQINKLKLQFRVTRLQTRLCPVCGAATCCP
eukprot:scaffold669655_cov99-Prasinocladus_malaysianus.AAC.1